MNAFHVDMNTVHQRASYLREWLPRWRDCGFDTILWELENGVRWETCPECVLPDAIEKDEFRAILAEAKSLGLTSIPLFQTIGHAEYVLKHPRYAKWKETPERLDMYCPMNPEVVPFLHRWIDEYLDLFGELEYFHIGADESWWLGTCPECKAYASANGLGALFVQHVQAVAEPLLGKGIRPCIWADMVLDHHDAIGQLSKSFVLYDWEYRLYNGCNKIRIWGREPAYLHPDEMSEREREQIGRYVYPEAGEPGCEENTFYTSDWLADQGFDVVCCAASSSYGDSVFAPRTQLHLRNTLDFMRKGMGERFAGSLLTSWSIHIFAWELQWPAMMVPATLQENPDAKLSAVRRAFIQSRFGIEDNGLFWMAAGLLANNSLFTYLPTLGFCKSVLPPLPDHVETTLADLRRSGTLQGELENARARLEEYRLALLRFESFAETITTGRDYLEHWLLAARNMIHRAETAALLLAQERAKEMFHWFPGWERETARHLLAEIHALREQTDASWQPIMRDERRRMIVEWLFAPYEDALEKIANAQSSQ